MAFVGNLMELRNYYCKQIIPNPENWDYHVFCHACMLAFNLVSICVRYGANETRKRV